MTSIELLKEIQSWLSFNTEPSKEEIAKLRKSIKEHLTEQLHQYNVVGQSEQLPDGYCKWCKQTPCERLNWSHPLEDYDE